MQKPLPIKNLFIYSFSISALLLLLSGCMWRPSEAYLESYSHLSTRICPCDEMRESDYFLVLLVNARHLDYTDNYAFCQTVCKHPSDGSKNGDVGHAWIYLQGIVDGKRVAIEGGHSGERGVQQARYFDGIMNYIEYGYANPTEEQKKHLRYEENPAKYLWAIQRDGFFQQGSGKHKPTFAAKIDITAAQFDAIISFIRNYDFSSYCLTGNQCSSFVSQIASIADISIESEVQMPIAPSLTFRGRTLRLWTDQRYSMICFATPDVLERSLIELVCRGKAENALAWYLRRNIVF